MGLVTRVKDNCKMLSFAFDHDSFTNVSAFHRTEFSFDPDDLHRVASARVVELGPLLKTYAFSQEDVHVSGILLYLV